MSAAHPSRLTAVLPGLTLLCALLAAGPCRAEDAPPPAPNATPVSKGGSPWLAEVRAQRRAWEAQRRAAREAIDARRRWQDPWAAAQYEAREQSFEQRRQERLEQIDRDRERFRRQLPWSVAPPDPWPIDAAGDREYPDLPPASYPPAGWDNGWYYRGY